MEGRIKEEKERMREGWIERGTEGRHRQNII